MFYPKFYNTCAPQYLHLRFECEYEILDLLRKERSAITFHIKAKEGDAEYALRVSKLPTE